MRKIWLTALVAASVVIPTLASAQSDSRRDENWESYREANEALYRLPAYEAPRGQRWHRVSTGDTLVRAFYADPYVIKNFAEYRLAAPARDQQYIRYGKDVVLINTRSGTVLKVMREFFL